MMDTLLTHPQNYKAAGRRPEQITYLVIHYTGNKGDSAKNNVDYYSRTPLQTSAHYFVDENQVWRSVPDEHIAWHCGRTDGKYVHPECRNANSIGIEICMWDRSGALRQGSIDRAAALARELMARYHIPLDHVVRHYDVTGKRCPAPFVDDPKLWDAFRVSLSTGPSPKSAEAPAAPAETVYHHMEDIPAALRGEAEALVACGALRGGGGELDLPESALRAMIVAKRYVDARLKEGG